MNQSELYTDHKEIDLEVTLKTGVVYPGLKCALLRTYSVRYAQCDAQALIHFWDINGLRTNGQRVEPTEYDTFKDHMGNVWKVNADSTLINPPPGDPALIFCLTAQT